MKYISHKERITDKTCGLGTDTLYRKKPPDDRSNNSHIILSLALFFFKIIKNDVKRINNKKIVDNFAPRFNSKNVNGTRYK